MKFLGVAFCLFVAVIALKVASDVPIEEKKPEQEARDRYSDDVSECAYKARRGIRADEANCLHRAAKRLDLSLESARR